MLKYLLLICALAMAACGGEPETYTGMVTQSVVQPVTVKMYVKPGTVVHAPPNVWHLLSDPVHVNSVSPIDVANNATIHSGTFTLSTAHGFLNLTPTEYANAQAVIDNPDHRQTIVTFIYDNSVTGDNKPVLEGTGQGPTFTLL